MPLISKKTQTCCGRSFATRLVSPVKLVMFTQTTECQYCTETRQIVEEVAALSDKIEAVVYDFVSDKATAETYGIDKIPAIALLGAQDGKEQDYGIRSMASRRLRVCDHRRGHFCCVAG